MAADGDITSPPRARLTFRVGVVGHRPDRLPKDPLVRDALRAQIAAILHAALTAVTEFGPTDPASAALYSLETPLVRAISPLAEGTDRIFAEEAIKLGYGLCCPMPFAQAEFETDFAPPKSADPDSLAKFHGILAAAAGGDRLVTFELDGDRTDEEAAYAAAGRVVLNQSDLLVIVWDGWPRKSRRGGTVDTLREALEFHVPVLWIDATAPQYWMLLSASDDLNCLKVGKRCSPKGRGLPEQAFRSEALYRAVAEITFREIKLPERDTEDARNHSTAYFAEHRPKLSFSFVWKWFRDFVGKHKFRKVTLTTQDYPSIIRNDWPVGAGDLDKDSTQPAPPDWVYDLNRLLRAHFAWADGLADRYADDHRSTGILSYGLAALAVLVALLPMAASWTHRQAGLDDACIAAEFLILGAIIGLQLFGASRRWHERWTEYRLLAELIRELKFLIPLGGGRPLPRTPIHLAGHGDPAQSWMNWQLRAIARSVGLQTTRVEKRYVAECLAELDKVAGREDPDTPEDLSRASGQLGYHGGNDKTCNRIHLALRKASFWLFALTIVGVALHFLLHLGGQRLDAAPWAPAIWSRWLTLASAFLPALGAALAGIEQFGEFARLAKRSRSMADGFRKFAARIRGLWDRLVADEAVRLSQVIPIASDMAEAMVDEVIDWRVVVLDPPRAG